MVCSGLSVFGNSIVRLATVTGVSSVSSERGGARQARHYMDPPLRFATSKWLLHIAVTTADWGRLYKLLYVVLDASICSLAMILP